MEHDHSVAGVAVINSLSKFKINSTLEQKSFVVFCLGQFQPIFSQRHGKYARVVDTGKTGDGKMLLYISRISLWGHYEQRSFYKSNISHFKSSISLIDRFFQGLSLQQN